LISKSDFIQSLENLKIKLTATDTTAVFDYLDKSKDGVLSYQEFCNLCEERRRKIDPFETTSNLARIVPPESLTLKKKVVLPKHQFGAPSLPSDMIDKIISH
jgi:hypothetical protein